jgi:hypothetical protein
MLVGLVAWLRRRETWRSFVVLFAATYVGLLLTTPGKDGRYLWPLHPVFIFGLLNGVRVVVMRVRRAWAAGRAERAVFAGAGGRVLVALVSHAFAPRPPTLLERPDVQSLFDRLRALRAEPGQPPMRVVFMNPRVVSWETGVHAMAPIPGEPEAIVTELRQRRITHVVVGSLGLQPVATAAMQRAVDERGSLFEAEFANGSFELYRFHGAQGPVPSGGRE